MSRALAAQVRDLARQVQRLQQDFQDPRRFYSKRDDLADDLSNVADDIETSGRGR